MANPEHLERLLKSAKENNVCNSWNKWRNENIFFEIDLSHASLIRAHLSGADLNRADLSGTTLAYSILMYANMMFAKLIFADLSDTFLTEANLNRADLSDANLSKAYLTESNLMFTNLSKTNMIEADLHAVNLNGSDLNKTNLSKAKLGYTIFANNDLSNVIGLESVKHQGPSTIGIDTLKKSKGKIPEVFLRGCGLQDWEIKSAELYNPNLSQNDIMQISSEAALLRSGSPIQFLGCFICYSSKDEKFAVTLENTLQNKGFRCWFDKKELKIGRIKSQLKDAILLNDKVILIVSEHSLKSNWVKWEVRKTLKREQKEKREIILPIRLDDAIFNIQKGWGTKLREYVKIGDFTKWEKEDQFEIAVKDLMNGIRTEKELDKPESDWFLEEEYSSEEIKQLKDFLAEGIKEIHQIEELLFYCNFSREQFNFHSSPASLWFKILDYAKSLADEDAVAFLISKAYECYPRNKYIVQAQEVIEKHYSEE